MKVFQLGENCVQRERGKLANVGVAKFLVRDREAAELKKQKADELLQQELDRQNMLEKLRDTVRVEGKSNHGLLYYGLLSIELPKYFPGRCLFSNCS